jgi:hypothetical protein
MLLNSNSDNRSDFNPYKVGSYIYELIGDYFKNTYDVGFSNAYPKESVNKSTIVYKTIKRVPGGGKNKTAQARGANFERQLHSDEFGQVVEQHKQQHTIHLEFSVFSSSSDEADDIAWDLENAVIDCEGELQRLVEGLSLSFEQQYEDTHYAWQRVDDLLVRTCRFQLLFPVRRKVILPELREIRVEKRLGLMKDITDIIVQPDSNSTLFTIPTRNSNQRISEVLSVRKRKPNSTVLIELYEGADYQKVLETDNTIKSLKWLREYGAPPKENESFIVEYAYYSGTTTQTIRDGYLNYPTTIKKEET